MTILAVAITVIVFDSEEEDAGSYIVNFSTQKDQVDLYSTKTNIIKTVSKGSSNQFTGTFSGTQTFYIVYSGNGTFDYEFSSGSAQVSLEEIKNGSTWIKIVTSDTCILSVKSTTGTKSDGKDPSLACSMEAGTSKGILKNTDTTMQYSYDGTTWYDCSNGQTEVNPGIVKVRTKETLTTKVSPGTTKVYVGPDAPTKQTTTATYEYNGKEQTFTPSGLESNWVTIGGTSKATYPKDDPYTVTVSPIGGCWSDGTSTVYEYNWKITKKTLTASDFTLTGFSETYNGEDHTETAKAKATLKGFSNDTGTVSGATTIGFQKTEQRIDVGEYPLKLTLSFQGSDYFNSTIITSTDWNLSITQKEPEKSDFEMDKKTTYTYNGEGQKPAITLKSDYPDQPDDTGWLSWTVGSSTTQTNANESGYAIEVTIQGSKNFKNGTVALDDKFIINKKTLANDDVTIAKNDPVEYDAQPHSPTVSIDTKKYTTPQPDAGTMSSWLTCRIDDQTTQTNAGTYQVKVYVSDSTNFKNPEAGYLTIDDWRSSAKWSFTIEKRQLTSGDFTITGNSVGYDGGLHTTEGITATLKGFTSTDIEAVSEATGIRFTTADEKRNAGSYPFELTVGETDNFKGGEITDTGWNLVITKKDPVPADFKVTVSEGTYNGMGQTATVTLDPTKYAAGQPDDVTKWLSWTVGSAATQIDANEDGYAIAVTVADSKNFSAKTVALNKDDNGTYKFIIHRKALEESDVVISDYTATFDTKTHSPSVSIDTEKYATPQPDAGTMSSWLACRIDGQTTQTEAGSYTITVHVGNSKNFKNPSDAGLTVKGCQFTVKKAELKALGTGGDVDLAVIFDDETKHVYNYGTSHTATIELKDPYKTYYAGKDTSWLTWKVGDSGWTDKDGHSQMDAGTYKIYVTVADNKNIESTETPCEIGMFTVERAELRASDFEFTVPNGKTYDGEAIGVASIELNNGDTSLRGLTWIYDRTDDTTAPDSSQFVSDAGTYQIKLSCSEDDQPNYKALDGFTDSNWKFTIDKADLKVTVVNRDYKSDYTGQPQVLKVKVEAIQGNSITLDYTWTQRNTTLAKSVSVEKKDGSNTATLDWTAIHVSDSGILKWTAEAGNNYNKYDSSDAKNNTDLTVDIAPFTLSQSAEPYEGTYDGTLQPLEFEVKYTLIGQDAGHEKDYIQVTYSADGSTFGGIGTIQKKFSEGPVPVYYELSYKDDTAKSYGDYSFPDAGSSTVTVKQLQMEADVSLDGTALEDSGDGMASSVEYDGEDHALIATAKGMKTSGTSQDLAAVEYALMDGEQEEEISAEDLASLLKSVGTYTIKVTVSAETGKGYSGSYIPFERTVTVEVSNASVDVTDFSYDTVTEGDHMTMEVALKSIGTLEGEVVVMYGGREVPTTCTIADNGDGTYLATVVYDTSLGIIPSGTLQTVTVHYGGDDNHEPSGKYEQVIRMRSAGMPTIPEEGGQIPIEPGQDGTDIVTPAGDIRFDIVDPPAQEEGDTTIIDTVMRYASATEEVPGTERTIILRSEGYLLHADGSRTQVKYRITPSVNVDVPSGKKPVITLYDMGGTRIGTPEALTYTQDFATFLTDVDGSISVKIGVTFESKSVPIPVPEGPEDPIIPADPETSGKKPGYTVAVVAGCIAVLLAAIALVARSGSRD